MRYANGCLHVFASRILMLWLGLSADSGLVAKPILYQASGTREEIQSTIDHFKHDVVYGTVTNSPSSAGPLGSIKVATFDTSNTLFTAQARSLESGGVALDLMAIDGSIAISAGTAAEVPNRLFGDLNPSYPSHFTAFSPPTIASVVTAAGQPKPLSISVRTPLATEARYSAFGAVFINVDQTNTAALGGSLGEGAGLFRYSAQPSQGPGTFSFVGVIDDERPFGLTWIELSPLAVDTVSVELGADGVAVDDVMLGWTPDRLPIVTRFEPTQGTVHTQVEIWGTDIMEATAVEFNGVPASFSTILIWRLNTMVPEGATTGPITVRTRRGSYTTSEPFKVNSIGPPIIERIEPGSGWVGQWVYFYGLNFYDVTGVSFNGVSAVFSSAMSDPGRGTSAIIPSGATSGPITVTTKHGSTITSEPFQIIPQHFDLPVIASVSTLSGAPGTSVRITGQGTLDRVSEVRFNGVKASFHYSQGWYLFTQYLDVIVPMGAGPGPLVVMTPEGTVTAADLFTVPSHAIVTGLSPNRGIPGTRVQILGTDLNQLTSVSLSHRPVEFTAGEHPSFIVPQRSETAILYATTKVSSYTTDQTFTVLHDVPLITDFSPKSGVPGTRIDLQVASPPGSTEEVNLDRIKAISFGDAPAEFTRDSTHSSLTAIVPFGATTGPITLLSWDGSSDSTLPFTLVPEIELAGFSPDHGPPGTSVEIFGTGLDQVTAIALRRVAAEWTRTNGLRLVVPENAISGPLVVHTVYARKITRGTFRVERPFDVRVEVEARQTNAMTPTTVEFIARVINGGYEAVSGVTVSNLVRLSTASESSVSGPPQMRDSRDVDLEVRSVSASQGVTFTDGGQIRWDLGSLPPMGMATVSIAVDVRRSGVVYTLASVMANQADPDSRNNEGWAALRLLSEPLLLIRRLAKDELELYWPSQTAQGLLYFKDIGASSLWTPVDQAVDPSQGWNRVRQGQAAAGRLYQLIHVP